MREGAHPSGCAPSHTARVSRRSYAAWAAAAAAAAAAEPDPPLSLAADIAALREQRSGQHSEQIGPDRTGQSAMSGSS
ncbi:hypothetical protein [Streptomyces sp. NBC_00887]|uniref:hypothetical protein n=1 Tax=Streptomyces sp. NBC_00887 TaxID=2975859 RepID=UPI003863B70C|nr:hypothetical protein OG844_21715 [Streptomyces sp. NBC_00887]